MPAISDHLGIGVDIDIASFFHGTYSSLKSPPGRILTLNNIKAKKTYIKSIVKEAELHNL
jgi:hypothetical protein